MESFAPGDAAGMQEYAEELRANFMRLQNEAPALHEKARAVQITETSKDGLISATVGPRGDLIRLDIDPRIYRHPDSRQLADSITSTVQKAAEKAQAKIIELFEPLIPAEQMKAHLDGDVESVLEQMTAQLLGKR
ncbi:YbaB/EbfC family nucleoid-associated protein [Sphaerisporangium fuscum]|uniref:YbaB/EbfC family nucleoid-associated protein n=1 Tax=Sphaerisporangium fuscum TaxID=2835868 RepID=UPI001BDD456F|nr:YbaB/EbfC family nucleoid-associated protein [Sphaerisporangium fuscum]